MEFSIKPETRISTGLNIPAREYTVVKITGPCLVCEQQVEYSEGWPLNEDHARRQFLPNRRKHLLERLSRGGRHGDAPKPERIEGMVCGECRIEYGKRREVAERQAATEKEKHDRKIDERRLAHQRHYEWRTATADEVDPTPHSTEFRVVFANYELHEIVFRWRAVPGKCRGSSYLSRVGMWADGKLVARYYGWNLQYLDDQDEAEFCWLSENTWPVEDLFGRGFCYWIERAFQERLLRLKPDQTWTPGRLGDDLVAPGVGACPQTLLVKWLDGTRYVHVFPCPDLKRVAEWAKRHVGMRIQERAFQPVPSPMLEEDDASAEENE